MWLDLSRFTAARYTKKSSNSWHSADATPCLPITTRWQILGFRNSVTGFSSSVPEKGFRSLKWNLRTGLPCIAKCSYRVVRDALRYLPKPGVGSTVPNHIGRTHSQRIIDRYSSLEFGERDPKTRVNKLHPDRPSLPSLSAQTMAEGKGHVHPFVPREVTPRESARMQTFPDWWEFHGTGRHVIRQVGNAVPPLFAALLAEHVKVHVFGAKRKRNYEKFVRNPRSRLPARLEQPGHMIVDLFSHKIHSSGDEWPDKLSELAAILASLMARCSTAPSLRGASSK